MWPVRLMRFGTVFRYFASSRRICIGVVLQARAAEVEHRPVLLVDDLDAQPFGRDVEQQLVLERLERLALVDGLLQVLHQRFELLALVRLDGGLGFLDVVGALRAAQAVLRRGRRHRRADARLDALHGARRIEAAAEIDGAGARAARAHLPGAGFTLLPGSMLGFLK